MCESKRKNINNCYSNLKSYINYTQQKENKNKQKANYKLLCKSKQKLKIKIKNWKKKTIYKLLCINFVLILCFIYNIYDFYHTPEPETEIETEPERKVTHTNS